MSENDTRKEFGRALLGDVAPEAEEFAAAYEASLDIAETRRRIGTPFGLPPELAGALGMAAILVGRTVFEKLLEWGGALAGDVAKKVIVDTAVDRLKRWLAAPSKENLTGVLTVDGQREILAIVDRDADRAGIAKDGKERLRQAVIIRLGITGGANA
jgi:hypothetical protein